MSGTQNVPAREFLARWCVKNLSFFGVKENQVIESLPFKVPFLGNSQWLLKLMSRDPEDSNIMCYLYRDDTGPVNTNVYYSISVGSSYTVELMSFKRRSLCSRPGLINRFKFNEDVRRNKSEDVLIVECRMLPDTSEVITTPASPYPVGIEMVTTIPTETESLFYEIPDFSRALSEGSVVEFSVNSAVSNPVVKLACRMSMEQQTLNFVVREASDLDFPFVLRCYAHLVDAFKDRRLLGDGQTIINPTNKSLTFPLAKSNLLLDNKDLYLPDGTLLLHLEFVFSKNAWMNTFVERTLYDEPLSLHKKHELKWGVYLNRKFNKHILILRLLALLVVALSILPHFWFDYTP